MAGVDTSQVVCFVILAVSLVLLLNRAPSQRRLTVLIVLALWRGRTPGQPRPTSIQIPIATKSRPAARVR